MGGGDHAKGDHASSPLPSAHSFLWLAPPPVCHTPRKLPPESRAWADRNFKGPFYTLDHVRYRLKRGHRGSPERAGVVGGGTALLCSPLPLPDKRRPRRATNFLSLLIKFLFNTKSKSSYRITEKSHTPKTAGAHRGHAVKPHRLNGFSQLLILARRALR